MTAPLTPATRLFGKVPAFLDSKQVVAIAGRLFQVIADYAGIPLGKKGAAGTIAARIEGFVADLDALHPVTYRPMYEHWHFHERQAGKGPEALRLLRTVAAIRSAIAAGAASPELQGEIAHVAHDASLATGTVATTELREKRSSWAGRVLLAANKMLQRNPRLLTTDIARRLADDPEANPTGKGEEAIRKLLNQGKKR